MRRDRVAIVGGRGLFEESVMQALASKRHLRVRRFLLDDPDTASEEIDSFEADVIVMVKRADQSASNVTLPHVNEGVAIVTLDPTESTMSFSCRTSRNSATLDNILSAVRAARIIRGSKRALTAQGGGEVVI